MKLAQRFDMTITRDDFLRLLPAAVNHVPFTVSGEDIFYVEDARSWRMNLLPLPELRIALVRLERHRLTLEFENYEADEIAAFSKRFELYFRRGGG